MKKGVFWSSFVLVVAAGASVFGAETPETSHLAFVTEYVRELAAVEDIRAAAEQELKQGEKQDVLANVVYTKYADAARAENADKQPKRDASEASFRGGHSRPDGILPE